MSKVIGKELKFKFLGRTCNLEKSSNSCKFQIATINGFINCISFQKDIIENIIDGRYIEITSFYPKQFIKNRDNKKYYDQLIVVNQIKFDAKKDVINSLKQLGYTNEQLSFVIDDINDSEDIDEQIGKSIRSIATRSLNDE